jgi:hypothetical protein
MNAVLLAKLVIWLIAILFFWLGLLMVRSAQRVRPVFTSRGELVMRYTVWIRLVFACFTFFGPLVVCVPAYLFPPQRPGDWFGVAGVSFFFVVVCGSVLLRTQLTRITVSGEGISYQPTWGSVRAYRWEDIVEVSSWTYTYPFVFRGRDGRKFTISVLMTNVPLLVQVLRMRLDPSVYEKAQRGIAWTGAPGHLVFQEFAKVFHCSL